MHASGADIDALLAVKHFYRRLLSSAEPSELDAYPGGAVSQLGDRSTFLATGSSAAVTFR
jgi:hypothetical protein